LKTIVYHQRLGDIINCFPAARHFTNQGEEVFIECLPQYAGALNLISYAKWVAPGEGEGEILDFQIWPERYNEYRNSGQSYVDFMYSHPALVGVDQKIILDCVPDGPPPGLPDQYNLLAPLGISQGWNYPTLDILNKAEELMGDYVIMCESKYYFHKRHWTAQSIVEMAQAIKHADKFMTINSATAILASALRQNRPTYFLPQKERWAQDNVAPWPGRVDVEI
jgi:hypothetical protein